MSATKGVAQAGKHQMRCGLPDVMRRAERDLSSVGRACDEFLRERKLPTYGDSVSRDWLANKGERASEIATGTGYQPAGGGLTAD